MTTAMLLEPRLVGGIEDFSKNYSPIYDPDELHENSPFENDLTIANMEESSESEGAEEEQRASSPIPDPEPILDNTMRKRTGNESDTEMTHGKNRKNDTKSDRISDERSGQNRKKTVDSPRQIRGHDENRHNIHRDDKTIKKNKQNKSDRDDGDKTGNKTGRDDGDKTGNKTGRYDGDKTSNKTREVDRDKNKKQVNRDADKQKTKDVGKSGQVGKNAPGNKRVKMSDDNNRTAEENQEVQNVKKKKSVAKRKSRANNKTANTTNIFKTFSTANSVGLANTFYLSYLKLHIKRYVSRRKEMTETMQSTTTLDDVTKNTLSIFQLQVQQMQQLLKELDKCINTEGFESLITNCCGHKFEIQCGFCKMLRSSLAREKMHLKVENDASYSLITSAKIKLIKNIQQLLMKPYEYFLNEDTDVKDFDDVDDDGDYL